MSNVKKLAETIKRISVKSGLHEGFLTTILEPFVKNKLKKDPKVKASFNTAMAAAEDLENAIDSFQKKYPDIKLPSRIAKYAKK